MTYSQFVSTLTEKNSYCSAVPGKGNPSKIPGVIGLLFYFRVMQVILRAYKRSRKENYGPSQLKEDAFHIIPAIEETGAALRLGGIEHIRNTSGAVVFIGNHMSGLETILFPAIILPYKEMTYILKRSLVSYPIFGPVTSALNPITVSRSDPREDLRRVLADGNALLKKGCSIIVFPQRTRTVDFDPKQFNSLGIKLAKKSNCPIIPFAVKTNLWGIGKVVKDIGPIDPKNDVNVEFGEPFSVESRGKDEHQRVIEFIQSRLASW